MLKKDKKNIIQINIDNLTIGKTSEGANMPSYRNPEYASFKTSINPKNRGYWDLTLTREFIKNIDLKISENEVDFFQKLDNEKTKFIFKRVPESWALGMNEEQWNEYNKELSRLVLKEIEKIIKV